MIPLAVSPLLEISNGRQPVMKNFSERWKALEDKKGGDELDVPMVTKVLPIIKWTEAFRDYLH